VAGRLHGPPPPAGGLQRFRIVAVEEVADPFEAVGMGGNRAVHGEKHLRAVRILVLVREPDRLSVRLSVAAGAVRQETPIMIGPEEMGELFHPFLRPGHDDGPPAPINALLQQLRKRPLQGRANQVIESDLDHRFPASDRGRRKGRPLPRQPS